MVKSVITKLQQKQRYNLKSPCSRKPARESGQAMYEYVLATSVLIIAFITPLPMLDNMSLLDYIVAAFKANHSAYIYASSLPS
ncbi:hypothetical protein DC094_12945 [Pelagibaculum spongiae]|uniref:Uncharacterized protein n=1 Tax=Pelagibaculum spongiae TaxID=2080658 RepID=A0A2V1H0L6_9GAMM|nr:hypothetical protein DC094_12945 [Pelagibaculum spongiae]